MQRFVTVIKQFKEIRDFVVIIASIILFGLNLFLAYKLTPITQDLSRVVSRVQANETGIQRCNSSNERLINKFDKFDTKVDNLAEDISFIKGKLSD